MSMFPAHGYPPEAKFPMVVTEYADFLGVTRNAIRGWMRYLTVGKDYCYSRRFIILFPDGIMKLNARADSRIDLQTRRLEYYGIEYNEKPSLAVKKLLKTKDEVHKYVKGRFGFTSPEFSTKSRKEKSEAKKKRLAKERNLNTKDLASEEL